MPNNYSSISFIEGKLCIQFYSAAEVERTLRLFSLMLRYIEIVSTFYDLRPNEWGEDEMKHYFRTLSISLSNLIPLGVQYY